MLNSRMCTAQTSTVCTISSSLNLQMLCSIRSQLGWLSATRRAQSIPVKFNVSAWLLLCFNRERKSRVSYPSRPLPGPQTTREESTSPRAAHEASGQVSAHSSLVIVHSISTPSLSQFSLSALPVCLLIFTPHAFSLLLPHSHSLHSPFPAVTPAPLCLLSGCWVRKLRLLA